MSAPPSKPERSLLDRLNALKPSSVSLDSSQKAGLCAAPGVPLVPGSATADASSASFALSCAADVSVSREDALAARLKTLRHARDAASSHRPTEPPVAPSSESTAVTSSSASEIERDEDDPLYFVDDAAVNDLLLELAEGGLGDEDGEDDADRLARDSYEDDYEIIPLPEVPKSFGEESEDDDGDDADHSKKVEDLLKSLAGTKLVNDDAAVGWQKDGDSDDSDGGDMDREIRRVLAQARDEIELEKQMGAAIKDKDDAQNDEEDDLGTGPRKRDLDKEDAAILPGDKPSSSRPLGDGDDADNHLGLPTVPTELIDPPSPDLADSMGLPSVPNKSPPKRGDDDDISARLAALRGLQGKAAGLGETDAFGLPSAPTFRPGEEEGGVLKRGHFGHGRRNYTDADQKAWCIVCLEDATVRCLGCADSNNPDDDEADQNNAYCTGCWQDIHVGPAAGFDERGHKRVPLVR